MGDAACAAAPRVGKLKPGALIPARRPESGSPQLPWKPALSKTNELAYMILQNPAIITAREREQRIMSAPSLTCLFSPLERCLHHMNTRGQTDLDIGLWR